MSHLENLIAEYCPDGVEYMPLSALASISTGVQLNLTKLIDDGEYPVMNGGINPSGYYDSYNTGKETITISQGGASAGYVNFILTNFWAGAHCYIVKPVSNRIENKFLYYFLKNSERKIQETKTGAGIPGLNKSKLEKYKISVPPIIVQQEIVRILDKMTFLEAELEAELEARILQYEHYRANLLDFNPDNPNPARTPHLTHLLQTLCPDGVEYKKLKDICIRQKGTSITAGEMKKLNKAGAPIRIFAGGNTFANVNYSDIPEKNVITKTSVIVKSRGNIGFEYYEHPFSHKNEMWSYAGKDENINIKFVYYFLVLNTLDFQLKAKSGKLPQISTPDTDNYPIPVPPLPIQEEIVAILDRFESLVSDLKDGLPAEITARRKQYEYYRNQLLTFKPKPPL